MFSFSVVLYWVCGLFGLCYRFCVLVQVLIRLICFLLWFDRCRQFSDLVLIGKMLQVVLYFGVMLLMVVWLVSGRCCRLLLQNLMNLFIMFSLCSIWVMVSIRLVVVVFLGSLLVSLKLIICGISIDDGWLSMVVFVLMLFMFQFSMLMLLIMVVWLLVLNIVFGQVIVLLFLFVVIIMWVRFFRFIWWMMLVLGGIILKLLKVFWFQCRNLQCFWLCWNLILLLRFSVLGLLNILICIEWLMISLEGICGLICFGLLLSLMMVLCIVVRLIMQGMLVKFCSIMCVGMNVILVFGLVVGFQWVMVLMWFLLMVMLLFLCWSRFFRRIFIEQGRWEILKCWFSVGRLKQLQVLLLMFSWLWVENELFMWDDFFLWMVCSGLCMGGFVCGCRGFDGFGCFSMNFRLNGFIWVGFWFVVLVLDYRGRCMVYVMFVVDFL